ncbi:adenylosuccinate synthase [Sulfobacillus harzensis]|uniref:Adenylosuccinate synthetase n=1 Tax=Sulfobacillus harzensis TaxID=2729629 RepID=A0A7Y0L1I3_9FIRM|nr:adenylosuccinate synthase [Sulfobacillus harzensis]NMP21490.1 adenylosuccinate synthase [Sulfobacillus harzensis]
MSATAVVGANWGDEGKGKMTDHLAETADVVVRFQGGNNAGHTILNPYGKFALHLLPSGVFYPHVTNVIGPGVAVNPKALVAELDNLLKQGLAAPKLAISDRAQVVLEAHVQLDTAEEERLGARQFGSTRSGIAPFYADKALKIGIRVADLFDPISLRAKLSHSLELKNVLLQFAYRQPPLESDLVARDLEQWAHALKPYVTDTTELLRRALDDERHILLEGQLGALRDPDHGIYPFTTSSSTLAGYATVGAGIPPQAIDCIIAVTKAYSSCVGAGPFVTELFGEAAQALRERGGDAGEYGATTGRPRRVGWFDAVATRYGAKIQGATELALTNLDVLSHWERIPVAVAYRINGKQTTAFPSRNLDQAEPIYETLEGWKTDITRVRRYEDLPLAARTYVERLETLVETPIRWISVGPKRDQVIRRP